MNKEVKFPQGTGCQIICFSSGKGGVGKTSITVNIALAISQLGKRVLLVDGDLGLANVDIVLGLAVKHTLREMVEEDAPIESILERVTDNFFVLPASSGVPEMASLTYEEQAFLTNSLDEIVCQFDYVLLDTAAGIGESVLWLNQWADNNIVIMTPDPTSLTDAYALIKVLSNQYDKKSFHLLVNNVKNIKEGTEAFNSMAAVLNKFLHITPELIGIIPQDKNVTMAIRTQKPFLSSFPDSKASKAVTKIAAIIAGS